MRTVALACIASAALGAAERINHEGRILAPTPTVTAPTLFNTAAADAVVSTLQIMPRDNPWNEDISQRPVLANSDAMMAVIRGQFAGNRQRAVLFQEMNYVLVPDAQALADINFTLYYEDSDFNGGTSPVGRYPIPANQPVEGWPANGEELYAYQRMTGGDRHTITVQPGAGRYFETWLATLTTNSPAWEASNGAIFNLASNAIRTPDGIGSGDAAGLPMLPALVRYDEIQRGVVEHALRLIVARTRDDHIYPATHDASVPRTTDPNVPAMGQRLRLKSSFAIPASWTAAERAVGVALKKYGAIMADNGSFFSMSICPDDRWAPGTWDHFSTGAAADFLDISNFEVVQTTGAAEGPRSPGAPTANAGTDQTVSLAVGASLAGAVTGSGLTTQWYLYPFAAQPGTVTFGSPGALATTVSFSAVGTYTLMLRASDGVHTPAYDAVLVTVVASGGTPPTVASATATPSPVTTTTTALAASASDDGGEAALTYTWSASGPAPVAFSPNGTNAAKSAVATFQAAGAYTLTVTARDAGGLTGARAVAVTVNATATSVAVSPAAITVEPLAICGFAASVRDQFGAALAPPPAATWGVSGGGAINAASGLFSAGTATGGPWLVTASAGGRSGTAQVTVAQAPPPPVLPAGEGGHSYGAGGCGSGALSALLAAAGVAFALRQRRR